ncbi:MAG TPA: hypothetical protein VJ841_02220 [Candidatus Saccharimonadales bacterium]|nr:hypothetical protein [Candidatus Saccharimonadales bacterium]
MPGAVIPRMRNWVVMQPRLEEIFGEKSFDVRDYLFGAFRQVAGQRDYPAYLFGSLMFEGFLNYLTLLHPPSRREVADELEMKFDDFLKACSDGYPSQDVLREVRAAYEELRTSNRWQALFRA